MGEKGYHISGSERSLSIGCCDMSIKCRCRWRWDPFVHGHDNSTYRSFALFFFFTCFAIFGLIALFFIWLTFSPFTHPKLTLGCQEDNEGSWSIGVYYGSSPFSLHPIEEENIHSDSGAAWPVANPVLTCASVSDASHHSNFVADPFLYIEGSWLYSFFETKNAITKQGDIGVAVSEDGGTTWKHLGIALDEEWHLSFPYIFDYNGQIYMMPEGRERGDLRLYRALKFPLDWTLERVLIRKPLVDAVLFEHNDLFWIFASNFDHFGAKKNGELEIWYADSPLGPWHPHKANPIYNAGKSTGARNGGRPFSFEGHLYRVGQDCGKTYGRRVRVFKVEALTKELYREAEVSIQLDASIKGRNAWNGMRYHHLDVQQLPSGRWIGLMDGDRVPSGDLYVRYFKGSIASLVFLLQMILLGIVSGAICFAFPLGTCFNVVGRRRSDVPSWWAHGLFASRVHRAFSQFNRRSLAVRGWIRYTTCTEVTVVLLCLVIGAASICLGVKFFFGGNGADEPYPVEGRYSQFTMLTMTYEARLWNLQMYVSHYSRCASVREIVVVWNKGKPPLASDFDSAVPVRVRVEEVNSLNNRFKVDPAIKTRAVLELDDDIMMTCDDLERGFEAWRKHPERLVGFYPRLIDGSPLKYRNEKYARNRKGYNMILTGAAFLDAEVAFPMYWSHEAEQGRVLVDELFNCEDILLNFIVANASLPPSRPIEYIHPTWAIDTSKFSSAAISRDTKIHYEKRTSCLLKFSSLFGGLPLRKWEFGMRQDGWDY